MRITVLYFPNSSIFSTLQLYGIYSTLFLFDPPTQNTLYIYLDKIYIFRNAISYSTYVRMYLYLYVCSYAINNENLISFPYVLRSYNTSMRFVSDL